MTCNTLFEKLDGFGWFCLKPSYFSYPHSKNKCPGQAHECLDYNRSRGFGGSIDHKVTIVLFISKKAIILL